MNSQEVQHITERMVYYLRNIGNIMKELNEQKLSLEQEIRELSHEKELSPLSASEMIRLAMEERRILRERRIIKNELSILDSFKQFQSSHELLKYDLGRTVNDMEATVKMHSEYRYQPKIRRNLKCAGKHMEVLR